MAKITLTGNAVVITSSLKLDEISIVEKYRPSALVLKGGEDGKEEVFRITTTLGALGDISKYGASFGSANVEGNAIITELFIPETEDVKAEIADNYGTALNYIGKLEEALPAVVEEIKAERDVIIGSIEVQ